MPELNQQGHSHQGSAIQFESHPLCSLLGLSTPSLRALQNFSDWKMGDYFRRKEYFKILASSKSAINNFQIVATISLLRT
jgi:hypothetical protein